MFLDEAGEVSTAFQVKLLRFLEDGLVTPLGAERGEPVTVRVVAATHRDLGAMVEAGRFRQDLYYRLAGYEIRIPPLRERLTDLPSLVLHLKRRVEEELGIPPSVPPTPAVLERLEAHPWPGNVRELAHVVRRVLIDSGGLDDAGAVERAIGPREARPIGAPQSEPPAGLAPLLSPPLTLEEAERVYVLSVLESVGGNKSEAARLLGIERKTLARKLKREGAPASDDGEGDEP